MIRISHIAFSRGGGNRFFLSATLALPLFLSNLKAVELNSLCTAGQGQTCTISTAQGEITNNSPFTIDTININASVANFINYSNISSSNQTFSFNNSGNIAHFINHGNISGGIRIYGSSNMTISNYGTMRGVWTMYQPLTITLNNLGVMQTNQGSYVNTQGNNAAHFALESRSANVSIQNYAMILRESQNDFNNFSGYGDKTNNKNSHLIIFYNSYTPTAQNVYFKDGNSKLILDIDFDNGFELGKEYAISKLVTDRNGTSLSALNVDFSRLTTRSELYTLTQSGNNFVVNIADSKTAGYSMVGMLHKSNIKTMNNFFLQSNNVIYQQKRTKRKRTLQRRVIRKKVSNLFNDSSLRDLLVSPASALADSWQFVEFANKVKQPSILESLESNESFAYKSDSGDYYANNATTNPNTTNQTRNQNNTTRRRITTTNQTNPISNPNANRNPQITQSNDKYYFILTPFVNHNLFFESGRYNLSGLEYGFLTAFSGKITPSNALGAHFMMSYGSLGNSKDKNFSITNLNLNIGLNYKFDMIWDMYLKARGDFYYFLNQVKTLTIFEAIKPNNLGFGLSVAYGKEWDFDRNGILGLEVALDYKGLMSPNILTQNGGDSTINETFNKALYNMLYVDLGLNYDKYFETNIGKCGLDTGLGVKVNATANALAKSTIRLNNIRDIDMVLDNDMFLAYLNIGGSYLLESKDFDMEFSLAYYGNFGDRTMSNAGSLEWRVYW